VYYVRNMCLGGDVLRGAEQEPFGEQVAYDYIMWIDSDQVFTPPQFQRLLDHDKEIVSAVYLMSDRRYLATDEGFFRRHGHFQFMTPAFVRQERVDPLFRLHAHQTGCL
jgi:hypothetical protein